VIFKDTLIFMLLTVGFAAFNGVAAGQSPTEKKEPYPLGRVNGEFPDTIEFFRDLEIGKVGERSLRVNIARPKGAKQLRPAVVFVHGGGWRNGSSHISGQIALLAENGFVGMTVDYRLSGEAKWPAQIEDCQYAVRWLRLHAADYGVDPQRIGAWGTSAGGHLAACLGVMADIPRFLGTSGAADQSSAVQAVVDSCGPTDFIKGSNGITAAKEGQSAEIITALIGAPYEQAPGAWKDASPLAYVRPGLPPFLFVHGEIDPVVPIRHAEELSEALQASGNSTEFLRIKGGVHSFLAPEGAPPASPALPQIYEVIMDFFKRKLASSDSAPAELK